MPIPTYNLSNYEKDFVEKKLVAYIGNKRKLIPLILKAIEEIKKRGNKKIDPRGWFVDYFSGTGVVARLGKSLGFKTIANDWEKYSFIVNKGFLENSQEDLKLFQSEGGVEKVLKELNSLTNFNKKNSYIAKYYCPQNDNKANPLRERLFYTKKNGIIIDNIREKIDELFPLPKRANGLYNAQELKIIKKKNLLLALLLYEASKRANTSGVFKAFHHGFGGKNQDALNRILGKVELSSPDLSKNNQFCKAYNLDALELAKKIKKQQAEIVYLDPPYNQHQYGSNYHLLNTIALNDKPKVNKEFMINGKKKDKSAIRKDWIKTKSDLCYKKKAQDYFEKLISEINSKYLLISYSTEGIIDFDSMLNLLSKKGKLAIVTSSYTRYRGGRQSNFTSKKNVEFIIIVDTSLSNQPQDIENIKGLLNYNKTDVVFDDFFPIDKIAHSSNEFKLSLVKKKITVTLKKHRFGFVLNERLQLPTNFLSSLKSFSFTEQNKIIKKIQSIYSVSNDEKIENIMNIINEDFPVNKRYFAYELLRLSNKIKKDFSGNKNLKEKILQALAPYLNFFSLSKNLNAKYERLKSFS